MINKQYYFGVCFLVQYLIALAWIIEVIVLAFDLRLSSREDRQKRWPQWALVFTAITVATAAYFWDEYSKSVRRNTLPEISVNLWLLNGEGDQWRLVTCATNNSDVTTRVRFFLPRRQLKIEPRGSYASASNPYDSSYLGPQGGKSVCQNVGTITDRN